MAPTSFEASDIHASTPNSSAVRSPTSTCRRSSSRPARNHTAQSTSGRPLAYPTVCVIAGWTANTSAPPRPRTARTGAPAGPDRDLDHAAGPREQPHHRSGVHDRARQVEPAGIEAPRSAVDCIGDVDQRTLHVVRQDLRPGRQIRQRRVRQDRPRIVVDEWVRQRGDVSQHRRSASPSGRRYARQGSLARDGAARGMRRASLV
jgi:hypothetical protein